MQGDIKENVIEWYTGSKTATVTFTQQKFINRIRRLQNAGEHVEIVAENADGSITAHIPLSAIHLTIYHNKTGRFAGVSEDAEG